MSHFVASSNVADPKVLIFQFLVALMTTIIEGLTYFFVISKFLKILLVLFFVVEPFF